MSCSRPALIVAALLVALLATCQSRTATAHALDPIGVSLRETASGSVTVRIDRPAALTSGAVRLVVGADCTETSASLRLASPTRVVEERELRCDLPLAGRQVRVDGLHEAGLDAVVRAELKGGAVVRGLATAREPAFALPERPRMWSTLLAYVGLGARHLALGLDHLLLVAGLVIITRQPRRAALALTAFTLGHSMTLSAAVLGFVRFPARWAELGIALSLLWLALAVVRNERAPDRARLWLTCTAIGLLHGLGFAAGLIDTGLPEAEVPLSLLGFNLGIELVQLFLVCLLLLGAALARRAGMARSERPRVWLGHALGAVAAMWCIERVIG